MLRRVALLRTDVSEELSASFIRVTRIGEVGTTLVVTSNRRSATMKNFVLWDIKTVRTSQETSLHSVLKSQKHTTSTLKSQLWLVVESCVQPEPSVPEYYGA
jgi:hypothetical protein